METPSEKGEEDDKAGAHNDDAKGEEEESNTSASSTDSPVKMQLRTSVVLFRASVLLCINVFCAVILSEARGVARWRADR